MSKYHIFKDGQVIKDYMNSAGMLFADAKLGMYLLCTEATDGSEDSWYIWSYTPEREYDAYVNWNPIPTSDVPTCNLLAALLIK